MSTTDVSIKRFWRHATEGEKIHYIITTADGGERHLLTSPPNPLYDVLEGHLLARGDEGPADPEG